MPFNTKQKKWVLVGLFVLLLLLFLYIIKPYLGAIFVGGLLAYFTYPLYKKLNDKIKRPVVSSAIIVSVVIIVLLTLVSAIIFPLVSQTQKVYDSSQDFIEKYSMQQTSCEAPNSFSCTIHTHVTSYIETDEFKEKSKNFLQNASSFFFKNVTSLIGSIISLSLFLIIMVFSMFYFLQHGKEVRDMILNSLPLQKKHTTKIYKRLRETINAVVGGNVSTALLQGFFGGLIFWILGFPAPLFWGLVMAILAFIPAVGPLVVWIPAAGLLVAQGEYTHTVILVVYCTIVLGYIDNFLKPKIIGDKIKLSSFAIFLAVIGGIQAFGILGLFIGPIVFALLVTFVTMYKEIA